MAVFQKEELVKANELERDFAGLIQKDTQKKFYKDRSAKIEHYSLMLRDEKISEKHFLKIMANMDNKIVFDEAEYPVLDLDEIEFADNTEKNLYNDILKESVSNNSAQSSDTIPVVLSEPATTPENVAVTSPEKPSILTRSKARKALKENVTEKALPAPTKRNTKRRAEEKDSEDATETGNSTKRSKVCQGGQDAIEKLEKIFDDIIDKKFEITSNSSKCIMNCDRLKAMLLLPCKHQPTCKPCYVLWKMHVNEKKLDVFCPVCQVVITDQIPIADD